MYTPVIIHNQAVEHVTSFKFLGVHIAEDLTWSTNISALVKKARKRIIFLKKLSKHLFA